MIEVWKDIKGYEGFYQVSNLGRIKVLDNELRKKRVSKKYLKITKLNTGYGAVRLSKNGSSKLLTVHRLVAYSFLKNDFNLKFVNHKDQNRFNNRLDNLEFVNHRENISHSHLRSKTSSKYTGVCFSYESKSNPWRSSIWVFGKREQLGSFSTELDAHHAYLNALEKYNLNNKYA